MYREIHQLIQKHSDRLSCLIHAYLHNIEGDTTNANYWYKQIGEQIPNHSLQEEWNRVYCKMYQL